MDLQSGEPAGCWLLAQGEQQGAAKLWAPEARLQPGGVIAAGWAGHAAAACAVEEDQAHSDAASMPGSSSRPGSTSEAANAEEAVQSRCIYVLCTCLVGLHARDIVHKGGRGQRRVGDVAKGACIEAGSERRQAVVE